MNRNEGGLNLVEDLVEISCNIRSQEAKDNEAVLLQEEVLMAIAAPSVFVGEMLGTVEFYGEARFAAEEGDFHGG